MIQTSFNAISTGASGMFGKQVVMYVRNGRQIIAKAPRKRPGKGTEGQERTKADFRQATGWSARVRGSDTLRNWYLPEAGGGRNVHNLSIADYLVAPVVHEVNVAGGRIVIRATDNFRVHTVNVAVFDASGVLRETGMAAVAGNDDWVYEPASGTLAGCTIVVVASDLPGNATRFEMAVTPGQKAVHITVYKVSCRRMMPAVLPCRLVNTG